ncbi:MAG TPA: hypothetical protein VM536_14530 [Chloroflexia bacterium]|nr:hypothetical protein [Chloroflexia bacterium]
MKTYILPRVLGMATMLLALLAIGGGTGVAHAAKSQLAVSTSPAINELKVYGESSVVYMEPGKSYKLVYKVYNNGPGKAEVQFDASTSTGWPVFLTSTGAVINPKTAVEISVVVSVPGTTTVDSSTLQVRATVGTNTAAAQTTLIVDPSPTQ